MIHCLTDEYNAFRLSQWDRRFAVKLFVVVTRQTLRNMIIISVWLHTVVTLDKTWRSKRERERERDEKSIKFSRASRGTLSSTKNSDSPRRRGGTRLRIIELSVSPWIKLLRNDNETCTLLREMNNSQFFFNFRNYAN